MSTPIDLNRLPSDAFREQVRQRYLRIALDSAGAGIGSIRIEPKHSSRTFIREWLPGCRVEDYLLSAANSAENPGSELP